MLSGMGVLSSMLNAPKNTRGESRSLYLKNASLLPGNLLHGVPQDAGVVNAQGGDSTHHWRPGDAVWQCPCCSPLHCGDIRPWQPWGQAQPCQLLPDDVGAVIGAANANFHHCQVHLGTQGHWSNQSHWQHMSPWIQGCGWRQVPATCPSKPTPEHTPYLWGDHLPGRASHLYSHDSLIHTNSGPSPPSSRSPPA